MNRRGIRILIVAVALCFVYPIYMFMRLAYTMFDAHEVSTMVSLPEYDSLFSKSAHDKLKLLVTTLSRHREPTSGYIFDSTFDIFICKIPLATNQNLRSIFTYENGTSKDVGIYSKLPSYQFEMKLNERRVLGISTLQFKYNGDLIKNIANTDNFLCYYLIFKTFSISYDGGSYDIFAKADHTDIPASMVFTEKNHFVYIMIMTVNNGKQEMPTNLLYGITKH